MVRGDLDSFRWLYTVSETPARINKLVRRRRRCQVWLRKGSPGDDGAGMPKLTVKAKSPKERSTTILLGYCDTVGTRANYPHK